MNKKSIQRIAWLADLHLDFLDAERRAAFHTNIAAHQVDGLVIAGDISNSKYLARDLVELSEATAMPVWFTLGNHDFYRSSVAEVRRFVAELVKRHPLLHWLPQEGVVPLRDSIGLVGVDSWADGRAGSYFDSSVELSDHRLIADMIGLCASDRLKVMQRLADEAEEQLRESLQTALSRFQTVLVVSHVPMFYEACLDPSTRPSGRLWLPHFCWHKGGSAISDVMESCPSGRLIALCGHTHTRARAHITDRIDARVAGAEYDNPSIEDVLDLDQLCLGPLPGPAT